MTTVAFRDGVLAADSQATDDTVKFGIRKVVRLRKGDVAGGCGPLPALALALQWLAAGRVNDPPPIDDNEILFTDGGELYIASGGWPGILVKGFVAVGSGAQGAMVAMHLGLTAEDAVAAVSHVDPGTGGPIDVLPVERPRKRK